ncbi:MAG: 4'-phosphopantetheinyl transferase superfamily protein [Cyclobacteriaceae bacterium]|nr:4'-phosphopantetheinyl transferase superfamily protein [Cyclobacteriaceae bacterium]
MPIGFRKVLDWQIPVLGEGEVHIWVLPLEKGGLLYESCEGVLTDQQLKRRDFLAFEQDKEAYVISQGSLTLLLSAYLKIAAKEVQLGRAQKGKPFSVDNPTLQFNLSNSGGLCVVAFCLHHPVGIDIEKVRQLPDLEVLIDCNFTRVEKADIRKSDNPLRRFFQFWTMKESYLKAIGEGMRLTPENLEFSFDRSGIKLLSVNGVHDGDSWQFDSFTPSPSHVGTLTMSDQIQKKTYYKVA